MTPLGEQLRNARIQKNWTPEAAARATKIRIQQIEALEAGRLESFASPAYARGFIRIYAQALGLEPARLLGQMDGAIDDDEALSRGPAFEYLTQPVDMTAAARAHDFGRRVIYTVAILVAGIVGFYLFQAYRASVIKPADAISVSEPAAPSQEPSPLSPLPSADVPVALPAEPVTPEEAQAAVPAQPAVPASEVHTLGLQALRTTWARVESLDGGQPAELFVGMIEEGTTREFKARQFNVKIAIPAAVNIIFDGYNYGPYSNSTRPQDFIVPDPNAEAR